MRQMHLIYGWAARWREEASRDNGTATVSTELGMRAGVGAGMGVDVDDNTGTEDRHHISHRTSHKSVLGYKVPCR